MAKDRRFIILDALRIKLGSSGKARCSVIFFFFFKSQDNIHRASGLFIYLCPVFVCTREHYGTHAHVEVRGTTYMMGSFYHVGSRYWLGSKCL